MLAYILAIAIAIPSLSLYLSAFFLPELHRQDDFLWSGIGLFYALVLWMCAPLITGGILLGQAASAILILSFGWQTVRLRRAIAHPQEQTDIQGFSFLNWLKSRFGSKSQPQAVPLTSPLEENTTPIPETIPETTTEKLPTELETTKESSETFIEETEAVIPQSQFKETVEETVEETTEDLASLDTEVTASSPMEETKEPPIITQEESQPEIKEKKGFSLKSLFSFGKSKAEPQPKSTTQALDTSELDTENEDELLEATEEKLEVIVDQEEQTAEKVSENKSSSNQPVVEPVNEEISLQSLEEESSEDLASFLLEDEEKTTNESYEIDFEDFVAEDDTETVIDNYQPKNNQSPEIEAIETTLKKVEGKEELDNVSSESSDQSSETPKSNE
ncbi:MAG TPA: hypothetical protein DCF68_16850 [Cyanothece sp. UBA12306]|nr:hypothetical protein [Cyanothece sp. UBA12306]